MFCKCAINLITIQTPSLVTLKHVTILRDLPADLHGLLTLMEEHRLGVFENRVLRRLFRPKNDEIIGSSTILHKSSQGEGDGQGI
jgi:hypothetical protein